MTFSPHPSKTVLLSYWGGKQSWSWLICQSDNADHLKGELFFPPLARLILEPFEQTGFKLNEAADILLFSEKRAAISAPLLPQQPTLHFFLSGLTAAEPPEALNGAAAADPDASSPPPPLSPPSEREESRLAARSAPRRLRLITGSLVTSFPFFFSPHCRGRSCVLGEAAMDRF